MALLGDDDDPSGHHLPMSDFQPVLDIACGPLLTNPTLPNQSLWNTVRKFPPI